MAPVAWAGPDTRSPAGKLLPPYQQFLGTLMSYQCLSIDEAKALIDSRDVTLADVRDPQSFLAGNIDNAINVSDTTVEAFLSITDPEKPLIIYCYHGNSSKGAAEFFHSKGYAEVYSMDGGYEEWRLKY